MGYFFLLPPGLDSLSVALEPPGAGTRLVHEKVALRDSEPTSYQLGYFLGSACNTDWPPASSLSTGALPQLGHSSRSGDSEVSPVPLSSPPLPLGLCFPRPSLREQLPAYTSLILPTLLSPRLVQGAGSHGGEQVMTKIGTPSLTSSALTCHLPSPPMQDVFQNLALWSTSPHSSSVSPTRT